MNNKAKPKPAPVQLFPSVSQMIALALDMAETNLERLLQLATDDYDWTVPDFDVDRAVQLTLKNVRLLREQCFADFHAFCQEWLGLAAILRMSTTAFSLKDCTFYRVLADTYRMFMQMAASIEFTATKAK